MKKLLVILLVLAMTAGLAACGGSKATHNDAGYYDVFTLTESGETYTKADIDALGLTAYLKLNEDGTGVMDLAGDVTNFEWEDGKLTAEGDTVTYVLAGGMLTLDLSDSDGEMVIIFQKGTEPKGGSGSAISGMFGKTEQEPEEPAGEPEPAAEPTPEPEKPADKPAASAGSFTPVSGVVEGGEVEIVSAEHFTDSEGKEAIRFYFDFTNTGDEPASCWYPCSFKAEQSGYTLVSTYASWEDDVPEYGNEGLQVLPGVTIRCVEEYNYKSDGGIVTFTIYDYYDHEIVAEFDPEALPGRPAVDWVAEPVEEPMIAGDLYDEATAENGCYIFVDEAEFAESYDDETELVRVYFDFKNGTEDSTSCYMALNIYAFQDGIQLSSGYSSEDSETDENYNKDVAPGEEISCSTCWELRSESPIEIIVDTYTEGIIAGCVYYID